MTGRKRLPPSKQLLKQFLHDTERDLQWAKEGGFDKHAKELEQRCERLRALLKQCDDIPERE